MKTDTTRSTSRKAMRGFTLIELLVVIAIISLLVSILLPSLNKAKDLAKSSVCLATERNVGTAVLMYTTDEDLPSGVVSGAGWDACHGFTWARAVYWGGYIGSFSEVRCPSYEVHSTSITDQQYENSDYNIDSKWDNAKASWNYAYGVRVSYLPDGQDSSRTIWGNNEPGGTGAFYEPDKPSAEPYAADSVATMYASPSGWNYSQCFRLGAGNVQTHLRHAGGASILYHDGHCEHLTYGKLLDYAPDGPYGTKHELFEVGARALDPTVLAADVD